MAMNPTNGMAAGQPGTGNPFAGRSGQVPAAQDVQGRQAPREEQAAQPIGPKQLSEATQVLLKYKSGKAALDRRIVENEHWYRLHRDTEGRQLCGQRVDVQQPGEQARRRDGQLPGAQRAAPRAG